MEIFELRYFVTATRLQNMNRAASTLHVSPSSISKAITRLESELNSKLCLRDRKKIQLTDQGKIVFNRANEILQIHESLQFEVKGESGNANIVFVGPETLLLKFGVELALAIASALPNCTYEFVNQSEAQAIAAVKNGLAHVAIIIGNSRSNKIADVKTLSIGNATFRTVVGKNHPLAHAQYAKKQILIQDVLKYAFVSPSKPVFGDTETSGSLDGWRDDAFPRKVGFTTTCLKTLEELVICGKAIAYVPDYFCSKMDVIALEILGCPHSCTQQIELLISNRTKSPWLKIIDHFLQR